MNGNNGTNVADIVNNGRYNPIAILNVDGRLKEVIKQEIGQMPSSTDIVCFLRIDGRDVYNVRAYIDGQHVVGWATAQSIDSGIRLAYRNAYRHLQAEEIPYCIYGA